MIMTSLVCLVMQLEAAHSGRFEVALKSNEACQSAPIKKNQRRAGATRHAKKWSKNQ